jgi:hypothetical protein
MSARLVAVLCVLAAASSARADEPIQVMVLGTYHFDNPGQDLHNAKVDDVTTAKRQAELADVATRLARWKPTKIALEARVDTADAKYPAYRAFKPAELAKNRDERVQVGFRLARQLRQPDVYAIDVEGDFPFEAVQTFAERAPATKARLAALNRQIEAEVAAFGELQKTSTTAQLLARWNDPARIRAMHGFYYGVLAFGEAKAQPGAELNAAWYARNAKIFAKLAEVARPGDRIIVMFGAGHAYWLRHFVETTPGFQLVEPNAFLGDVE